MAVFVLTLLAVAAGFFIYQWGGNILLQQATPKGHFAAGGAGDGPDYADSASWLSRPGLANDPSLWLPDNMASATAGPAAVFYVHPTTYLATDRWNVPLHPAADTEFRTRLFTQSQASVFNSAGQIWAPRYRQAAYGAFLLKSSDAQKALDLAYADVSAAFDRFLAEAGDKPIILAGHSQGALHLTRLLAQYKDRLRGRLIAAYVVGWPVSTSADLPTLGFPACAAAEQTGCILSWMSYGEPANSDMILGEWSKSRGTNGSARRREDVLCVNPLTEGAGPAAPPGANPGTLVPSQNFASAALVSGKVGARCDKGQLIVGGEIPPLGPYVLPGNNYHVYDYALFWAAIRRDAERRTAAWRR
jgi:pimeloyl-ACP methyl ester carboxylesterase